MEWTESDKHIKLIGLKTITMKKNNYDQAKRKTWMESVKGGYHSKICNFVDIHLIFVSIIGNNKLIQSHKKKFNFLPY